MPSPLEVDTVYGQVWSDVSDGATGGYPTALLPMSWPTTAWSMSIEAVSSQVAGSYVALGVTDSGSTLGNLVSASKVSLLVRMGAAGSNLSWELWQGGATRTLLASGPVEDLSFNQLKLQLRPAAADQPPPGGSYAVARLAAHRGPPWRSAICRTSARGRPEADAAAFALGMAGQAEEGLEDALAVGLGHTRAAVAHAQLHRAGGRCTRATMSPPP
jgi:hypothetical protein